MTVSNLKYFKYHIPFIEPLKTASGNITERNGLIVILKDNIGNEAYGEIAPLEIPGMTSISECVSQIEQIKIVPGKEYDIKLLIRNEKFAPEVKFGIEQALHSLELIRNSKKDSSSHSQTIAVNALLGLDEEEEVLRKAGRLIEEGYSAIKIKIDNSNIDGKIELLKKLGEKFGNAGKIRLDANGSLSIEEASAILSALNPDLIEYIEDPVIDLDDLLSLQEESDIRIALDEPVTSHNVYDLLNIPSIKYYVIKPVKFGFYETIDIINAAELKNKSVVISSIFETAVGRSALVYLASLIKGAHAHGLDTGKYLSGDLKDSVYNCDKPVIEFNSGNYPPVFHFKGRFK